ncbi:nucleotidyltransferase domain-containing protein [Aurantimonas sp. A2-1-M11]|uniref:nucleotidyltransferase domain-containing protein n=1 Tax=Aurantimonas sp. A2-1-M11 TaxID=3113712 RepID=UPI002F95E8AC
MTREGGSTMNRMDDLLRRRTDERRKVATARARQVVESAKGQGIEISIVGSLARDRFRVHSDVDLLVHGDTDPKRRVMIERLVADRFRRTDLPYDLIFASDLSSERVRELLDDCL